MSKSVRKKLKWLIILISAISMLIVGFSGRIHFLIVPSLLFWPYVILDKYKNLKKGEISRLYKEDEPKFDYDDED